MTKKVIQKAARLVVLMRWQEKGLLDNLSVRELARIFPDSPHYTTIASDLREIKVLRGLLDEYEDQFLINLNARTELAEKETLQDNEIAQIQQSFTAQQEQSA